MRPTLIADAPLPKPLFEQLKEFNETIQYTNPTSKTIYTNRKSRGNLVAANLANEKIPEPVRKSEVLFVEAEQGDETFESNQVTRAPNRSPHSWRSSPLCASVPLAAVCCDAVVGMPGVRRGTRSDEFCVSAHGLRRRRIQRCLVRGATLPHSHYLHPFSYAQAGLLQVQDVT
eukprot:4489947-Prymnesium_polylepis.1